MDRSLVTGSPEDPDRIFSSEVIFALSHARRNELFKNYYDPSRVPNYVFRMDSDMFSAGHSREEARMTTDAG